MIPLTVIEGRVYFGVTVTSLLEKLNKGSAFVGLDRSPKEREVQSELKTPVHTHFQTDFETLFSF